jgi:hypothetical protein
MDDFNRTLPNDSAGSDPSADAPNVSAGSGTIDAVCSCGAGPHATLPDRCARGHAKVGNQLSTIVGDHGIGFWRDNEEKQGAIVAELLSDIGYATPDAAPLTIRITAHSLAQCHLVNKAAYRRMLEAGGPLSESGKPRRAYSVWKESNDSLIRDLKGAMNDLVAAHTEGADRTRDREAHADLDTLSEDALIEQFQSSFEQYADLVVALDNKRVIDGAAAILRKLLAADPAGPGVLPAENDRLAGPTSDFLEGGLATPLPDSGPVLAPPAPATCQYCKRTPCCGVDHVAYEILHDQDPEIVKQRNKKATAEMLHQIGKNPSI